MEKYTFLAFDLGATSGRSVVGTLADGKIEIQELTRFPNGIVELHGKFYWNLMGLYQSLKEAMVACVKAGIKPDSIGIDTWGIDLVPLGADGSILSMPRAYRDPYTVGAPEKYFERIPREEVYEKTGIQIMNMNTLYQLFAGVQEGYEPYLQAKEFLFTPDALAYMLTGNKVWEYTIGSTSQIMNPRTGDWNKDLLEATGLCADVLGKPILPGTVVGTLTDALAEETGIGKVKVVAVAGHDTASAVASVPATDENFAYLSSGTWSLMGIETREPVITPESYEMNFTNEGGVEGTTRFLKNICGMWILEQCRKEWKRAGKEYTYPQIVEMAMQAEPFQAFIYPDDDTFANPPSMLRAIEDFCNRTGQTPPASDAQIIRCIFESLALRYRETMDMLVKVATFPIERLHVIGGGSKNALLNQFTANAIGKKVVAGPSEATAIGNVMIQAMGAGVVSSLKEMRAIISQGVETQEFMPEATQEWEEAFKKYQTLK